MAIPYIGRRFTPSQFEEYLKTIEFTGTFRPTFVTLHHTASPSLAQRPTGFEPQHLLNLKHYYEKQLGWSGAPHLFIDDREDGIIVFQRLDRRGVHAASFNRSSLGIEMLGYYDTEPFHTGRGAEVRDMSMKALALLCKKLGAKPESIKFHRDDPKTSKSCPGRLVTKADVVARVSALMTAPPPDDLTPEPNPEWKVILPGGEEFIPIHQKDGRPIAPIRAFLSRLSPGGKFAFLAAKQEVAWTSPQGVRHEIPIAEVDDNGATWALIRPMAVAAGKAIAVNGLVITLS
jgi:hypothetical protein